MGAPFASKYWARISVSVTKVPAGVRVFQATMNQPAFSGSRVRATVGWMLTRPVDGWAVESVGLMTLIWPRSDTMGAS